MDRELLRCEDLVQKFGGGRTLFGKEKTALRALDGVSLSIASGETLGVVGESGSGKSTLARAITRLHGPTEGRIFFEGTEITGLSQKELIAHRRNFQMVFQDPYASLNPRMTVGEIVAEPLGIFHARRLLSAPKNVREDRVDALLSKVGLSVELKSRYPFEFSGGQRQRIAIARALALSPKLLVCDEPVSALDVSIQAQIVNLLADLKSELGIAYLFISHDLAVVRHISDRVAVMFRGRVMELAPRDGIFEQPYHPYTRELLADIPVPDPDAARKVKVKAESAPFMTGNGCRYRHRCPFRQELCDREEPSLEERSPGRFSACHYWKECASA